MDVELERETKLAVPAGFALPSLAQLPGVVTVATRTLQLRATYWDSEDLRLVRGGTTLRHRTGEGRPRWTLKLQPPEGPGRLELSVPGPGASVPDELADLVLARLRGSPLQQVVQLRTRRTSCVLLDADGRQLAEVVDDEVTVPDGTGWRELEVELRDGGEDVARAALELLRAAGADDADQTPKAVRALGRAAAAAPDLPEPGRVRAKDPAADLVRAALRDGLRKVVTHDAGVRRGADDAVHQLRVACRRLRSDLRSLRPLLDDDRVEPLRAELAWLAGSLGAARDLEVLRDGLRHLAAQPPALEVTAVDVLLEGREEVALTHALDALRSGRYLVLLQLLHDVAVGVRTSSLADGRCADVLPDLLARPQRRLDKAVRRLHVADPDEHWHRARILAKRSRYAAEAAQVALGSAARRQAEDGKRLQTVLGEHQDAAVAERTVLDLAEAHPDDHRLAVLCGRLAERARQRAVDLRATLVAGR